mmetsp:Transcript_16830/g.25449  ORF Transcript_16830/g.25449 Transcript_16830/m.25449 type:complete len:362 (+) Transcript_16830:108-1193(+)|eukprot:CAMPEP_0178924736 /NCGR_PEP_ID=MMETSP0786-20121207/17495_1 /TAXON_ID=186022 /ORGANISM="Thalassionema frauenfeldii, Strain CCMP 1798" /LENGTH=361 /DNA_ID=CAMNT_0020599485 /DNA_START=85 /DNA_END=1170 /DNA_ORIENTATION=+
MADNSYYGHAASSRGEGDGYNQQHNNQQNSFNNATAAASPNKGGGGQTQIDADKIFVGGLSWQTTEESLRYHFEQYGPVLSVEVMKDRVTGDPRGFAFVVFTSEATVDLVMEEGRHEINHKVVDVKRAQARGIAPPSIHEHRRSKDQPDSAGGSGSSNTAASTTVNNNATTDTTKLSPEQLQNKIFIGGLPPHVDKDELKRVFEQFGTVADAIVMMDQAQQRSRGFGFVTYENGTGGAQKALAAQPVNVHGRMAEVKLATPKGEQAPGGGNFHANRSKQPPASLGLRAGISGGSSTGEFAGLAASFGRNGWKAGYGTKAFGAAGWDVQGWDDGGDAPEQSGFSFDLIENNSDRPTKRMRAN